VIIQTGRARLPPSLMGQGLLGRGLARRLALPILSGWSFRCGTTHPCNPPERRTDFDARGDLRDQDAPYLRVVPRCVLALVPGC